MCLHRRYPLRRKFVQTVDTRDFFRQIGILLDVRTESGNRHQTGVVTDVRNSQSQFAENIHHLHVRKSQSQQTVDLREGAENARMIRTQSPDLDQVADQFASGKFEDQGGGTAAGVFQHIGIHAAFKTVRSIGRQTQTA